MTRILQFTAPEPLHEALLASASYLLSVTAALGTEPDRLQVTKTVTSFSQKVSDANTWWLDYDAFIARGNGVMTPTGLLCLRLWIEGIGYDPETKTCSPGSVTGLGIAPGGPMIRHIPGLNVPLAFIEVEDLVGAGYILADGDTGKSPGPEPMPDDDPPPFEPNPDDNPDLSLRDTTPPPEIPSVGWIFVVATTAQIAAMAQAATDAGLDDGQDQTHRAGSSADTTPRWALKKHKLSPALLEVYGDPYWQVDAPAIWGATAQWPAEAPYS